MLIIFEKRLKNNTTKRHSVKLGSNTSIDTALAFMETYAKMIRARIKEVQWK